MSLRMILGILALCSVVMGVIAPAVVYMTTGCRAPVSLEELSSLRIIAKPPLVILLFPKPLVERKIYEHSIAGYKELYIEASMATLKVTDGGSVVKVYSKLPQAARAISVEAVDDCFKLRVSESRVVVELGDRAPRSLQLVVGSGVASIDTMRPLDNVSVTVDSGVLSIHNLYVRRLFKARVSTGTITASIHASKGSIVDVGLETGSGSISIYVPAGVGVCIKTSRSLTCPITVATSNIVESCGKDSITVKLSCSTGSLSVTIAGG